MIALTLFVLVHIAGASQASAHPLGNFTVNRYARIELSAEVLRVSYVVDFAEVPAYQVSALVDADPDGYRDRLVASIIERLSVEVDGSPLHLRATDRELTRPEGEAGVRRLRVETLLEAPLPASGPRQVLRGRVVDENEPDQPGWREIVVMAAGDATVVRSSVPQDDESDALRAYPKDRLQDPLDTRTATFAFTPGSTGGALSQLPREGLLDGAIGTGDRLGSLMTRAAVTPWALAGMLGVAALVGAGHALAPGHGKTVMAAYLVGTKGRPADAVLLGVLVSLMHTASVLLLGGALLLLQDSLALDGLFPLLTTASGVGVVAVGGWLGVRRAHTLRLASGHGHHHGHGHGHALPAEVSPLSRRGLVLLATAGGMVPSPSAVVVLVSAFALGRLAMGLSLVLAFSVGLALTLMCVGLAFVFGSRALDLRVSHRFAALSGLLGALVLIGAGVVLIVRGTVAI